MTLRFEGQDDINTYLVVANPPIWKVGLFQRLSLMSFRTCRACRQVGFGISYDKRSRNKFGMTKAVENNDVFCHLKLGFRNLIIVDHKTRLGQQKKRGGIIPIT